MVARRAGRAVPCGVCGSGSRHLRCSQKEPAVPFGIVSGALRTWLNVPRPSSEGSACTMQPLTAGITKAGTGLDGIVWNILGQTYVPKSLNEHSFSWHATFPPGTFVPPHIHPTQDE